MDAHSGIASIGAHGLVAAVVIILDSVKAQSPTGGLIQELYRCHDIGVARVMFSKVLDGRDSLGDCISLQPGDGSVAA